MLLSPPIDPTRAEFTAVGVVDFDSGTTIVSAMSTDKEAVKSAVQSSKQPSGGTHISEGLTQGLSVMDSGSRSGARRVRARPFLLHAFRASTVVTRSLLYGFR